MSFTLVFQVDKTVRIPNCCCTKKKNGGSDSGRGDRGKHSSFKTRHARSRLACYCSTGQRMFPTFFFAQKKAISTCVCIHKTISTCCGLETISTCCVCIHTACKREQANGHIANGYITPGTSRGRARSLPCFYWSQRPRQAHRWGMCLEIAA